MYLLPTDQRFDVAIRQVFPVRLTKGESFSPREPDPPRRPGMKGEPVPRRLAAESSLWGAFFDVMLKEDRRRHLLEAMREVALDQPVHDRRA